MEFQSMFSLDFTVVWGCWISSQIVAISSYFLFVFFFFETELLPITLISCLHFLSAVVTGLTTIPDTISIFSKNYLFGSLTHLICGLSQGFYYLISAIFIYCRYSADVWCLKDFSRLCFFVGFFHLFARLLACLWGFFRSNHWNVVYHFSYNVSREIEPGIQLGEQLQLSVKVSLYSFHLADCNEW